MIGLDHINIRVEDLEAVRDFLLQVLPLEQGFRPDFDFAGYWLYLGGKPIIHLADRGDATVGTGWVDHLAFAPFDFETERQRLDRLGLSYTVAGIPGTGIRQLFVTGPEGVKVELQCREQGAPW